MNAQTIDLDTYATDRGFTITRVVGRMPIEARRAGETLMAMNFRTHDQARRWLAGHPVR